jgi:hypothetical protein
MEYVKKNTKSWDCWSPGVNVPGTSNYRARSVTISVDDQFPASVAPLLATGGTELTLIM